MNINWNRKYLTIAVYATCAVIVSAIAVMIIFNFDSVMAKLSAVGAIASPIVIGIFCAYLLNPLMTNFENGLFRKLSTSENKKTRGKARALSLTLTMLVVVMVLALVVIMVIPQLVENLVSIFSNMDSYIATIKNWLNDIFEDHPEMIEFFGNPLDDFSDFIGRIWKQYSTELMGIAGNVAAMVWAVLDTMKNLIIGLTISIYLLARKEMFIGQTKKLIFSFLKVEKAQRFLGICREASKKFLGSIIGKIIEAFVVALLCFIGTTVMGLPYALLISAIMFVFNLIPYIGPFIGAIPCVILLLLSNDPIQALWFVIFVLVLQTVDGNILAPWILGDSTGLPAVWILISILVGGGLFGMLGMFLGVPVCAVVYMLFKDFIENRLKKRKLPRSTSEYAKDVSYITPEFAVEEPDTLPEPVPEKKHGFTDVLRERGEMYKKKFHIKPKNRKK
ncbi:MAG: AI-2E family transporter [Oscillospiraceae bacterium]|nr:AI-2E family transporter [Oscillospiraceae bacterium]